MNPSKDPDCGICSTPVFERNNYFYGKQFTVRDLLQEQQYLNQKRWLVNRSVLGYGVVCGLRVRWNEDKHQFIVGVGLAIDCCGRELLICQDQSVPFEEYNKLCQEPCEDTGYDTRRQERQPGTSQDQHRPNSRQEESEDERRPNQSAAPSQQGQAPQGQQPAYDEEDRKFVLCIEYSECNTEEIYLTPLVCDESERKEFNRIRETAKVRVRRWKDVKLPGPNGEVKCLEWPAFDESTCETQPLHQALCRQLTENCPKCECGSCVVLATLTVEPRRPNEKECRVVLDTCTYRQLVYRNPQLFQMLYCHHGDLPHIVDVSWRSATRPERDMEWDTFVKLLTEDGLTVTFDQEMEDPTLNTHTFVLSFLDKEEGTGHFFHKVIPGTIKPGKRGNCYTATFIPDEYWVKDELLSRNSQLADGVDVEIMLRGSHIQSRRGKALDGEFISDKFPTGNGVQGGDFVDWFRVLKRGEKKSAKPYEGF